MLLVVVLVCSLFLMLVSTTTSSLRHLWPFRSGSKLALFRIEFLLGSMPCCWPCKPPDVENDYCSISKSAVRRVDQRFVTKDPTAEHGIP